MENKEESLNKEENDINTKNEINKILKVAPCNKPENEEEEDNKEEDDDDSEVIDQLIKKIRIEEYEKIIQ